MKKISNYYVVSEDEILKRFSDKPNPIAHLEKELTVFPKAFGADKPEPMITYKKEDTPEGFLYYIPFRWGKDNFGEAEEDVSLGYPIDIKLNSKYPPRDHQIGIIDDLKTYLTLDNRVLLEAPPATGKSYIGCNIITQMKLSACIIVGRSSLISQWRTELLKFTSLKDEDIGLLKGDVKDVHNKSVVIISTDSFYDRDFNDSFLRQFAVCIMDECHNFCSQQKFKAIGKLYAKYQIAMSATHERLDNRDMVTKLWFGDIQVTGFDVEPVPIKVIIHPIKHSIPMNINYQWFKEKNIDPKWTEMSKLSELEFRNLELLNILKKDYDDGREILFISSRTKQLQKMYELCLSLGIDESNMGLAARDLYTGRLRASFMVNKSDYIDFKSVIKENGEHLKMTFLKNSISVRGFVNKKEVYDFVNVLEGITKITNIKYDKITDEKLTLSDEQIRLILYNRDIKITFSTYGLFREGVSIWWKDCLIDGTPQSGAKQLLGRVGREAEDGGYKRAPIARTPWDYGRVPSTIKRTHQNRKRNYEKMDYVTLVRSR